MKETIILYPVPGHGHLSLSCLPMHPPFPLSSLVSPPLFLLASTLSPPHIKPKPPNQSPQPSNSSASPLPLPPSAKPSRPSPSPPPSRPSSPPPSKTSPHICPHNINIPTYFYFTSGASALALFLYFPTLHTQTTESFKDLARLVHIPGLPPINFSHLPQPILDREAEAYHYFLNFGACLPKSNGIIVNTFDSLEPRAIKAINNGDCTPKLTSPPPELFCIGPIVAEAKDRAIGAVSNSMSINCFSWLDNQPNGSVVFLCFGSKGEAFSGPQIREIAIGLERSDQRFLWVAKTTLDLAVVLPEGFLERTKERGLVVESWAPQAEILKHGAVGGFVSHCGWNSVVEAVSAGVGMVAWPLYAEQWLNRVVLVEMEVAIAVQMDDDGWVIGDEVERSVRELMGVGEGRGGEEAECGGEGGGGGRLAGSGWVLSGGFFQPGGVVEWSSHPR
ncbi:UDP-glucosyl transferase 88A1 [Actinidia rufa]|uniref:UDP-glucosyl transferase 88A1 n=1 Tax=Actinidia rufa TaxID=165716 RepID=A0A7J0EIZ7_9ERIC|nr:UDP-glucosyl transferase 88A1 [Actinidia rufa]